MIQVILLMLALTTSYPFTITLYRNSNGVTLRYPKGENIHWLDVCVLSEGKVSDRFNPDNAIPWSQVSCWEPRFSLEQYTFRPGALRAQAVLMIKDGEEVITLRTEVVQVRPEPEAP